MDRRVVVQALASAPIAAACRTESAAPAEPKEAAPLDVVLAVQPLGFPFSVNQN